MDSNKKAEDTFKKDKSFKNGERKSSQHVKYEKKHGSSNRHSYHQQMGGGMLYNGHENIYEVNGDSRSFVTRERSFVRPQSTATLIHSQMKEHQHQKRRSGMVLNPKGKPALEIYRPPTLRSSTLIDPNDELFNGKILHNQFDAHGNVFNNNQHSSSINNHSNNNNNNNNNNNHNNNNNNNNNGVSHVRNKNAINSDRSRRPGLNIHAKEFVSIQGNQSLHHSMSSSSVNMFHQGKRNLQHSKSGAEIKQEGMISSSKVHFAERKDNDPEAKLGMTNRNMQSKASLESYESTSIHNPIKRSKSLGSVDLRKAVSEETLEPLAKIGPLSKEVQKLLSDAVNDPNKLSARQLMDAVRHIIVRVIETSRYSEPGAQICIRIIQREKGETFLETLLNTCQEYYQERQRLLRNTQNTPYAGGIVSYPRWIAYMSFLNEMYTQLKRRHNQLMTQQMKNNETPPGIHLLTLLAQCCNVCLQESVINSLSETECLFFVLTAVGKDIELKLPQHMARVMCAARDAFLTTVHLPAVRKTLLQLIEMHAARWNLSAPAVMYYYPGCCPTK